MLKKMQKGKIITGLYKNGHNWLAKLVCHSGIEPSTPQCSNVLFCTTGLIKYPDMKTYGDWTYSSVLTIMW